MTVPRFSQANALRWAKMPGVATGFYAWCISAKDPKTGHAHKTKVRVLQALCGVSLKGGIQFPGTDATPCPACMKKTTEMEAMLGRTPRKSREEAAGRVRH